MIVVLGLLLFVLVGAFLVALVNPRWVFRRDMGRGRAAAILGGAIFACFALSMAVTPPRDQTTGQATGPGVKQANQAESATEAAAPEPEPAPQAEAEPDEPERAKLPHPEGQCALYGGYVVAITENAFEQAVGYAVQGDTVALQKLIDSGVCAPTAEGVTVFVEDMGLFNGMATVRVPGTTTNLYTNVEALCCD